jgi:hypothetical protein
VWVVTACEGMIALFEKKKDGSFAPRISEGSAVFPTVEQFQQAIRDADGFDQLVIIGSSNDMAWIHTSLPPAATGRIAAEIEYPLLAAWFKQPPPLAQLAQVLSTLFSA